MFVGHSEVATLFVEYERRAARLRFCAFKSEVRSSRRWHPDDVPSSGASKDVDLDFVLRLMPGALSTGSYVISLNPPEVASV
jgi:hypothetical protein